MIYVYIENKKLLRYIVNILDSSKIKYTTDETIIYDSIMVGDINKRTLDLIKKSMFKSIKIILVTYSIEIMLDNYLNKNTNKAKIYIKQLKEIIQISNLIITSNRYYKKIFGNKSQVIPFFNSNFISKYNYADIKLLKLPKKYCIIIDDDYKHIEESIKLINLFPKIKFLYLGYKDYNHLSKSNKNYLNSNHDNVEYIKYYDETLLSVKAKLTINYRLVDQFINKLIFNKYPFIMYKNNKYNYLYTNYQNIYLFDKDNLESIFEKVYSGKLGNITDESFKLINNNSFDKIVDDFSKYLS